MTSTLINREAGDKAKGPRLQRLRCVKLILDALEKSSNPYVYGAVEHKEDVIIKDVMNGSDYLEQNKNFDPSTSFTFNSPEILNTMVGYCDLWIEYGVKSKEVYLCFYTTKNIGQEQTTGFIKASGLALPDKPILELLESQHLDHPNLLPVCKQIILNEYRKQYQGRKDNGFLSDLEKMTDDQWKKFFLAIDWKFGEYDEEELKDLLLQKIRACRFFNHTLHGREELILSRLLDVLDEKQCMKDVLGKFVSVAEVQIIFNTVSSEAILAKQDDPIYEIWKTLKPPDDKRSIIDKLKAVCVKIDSKKLAQYARRTAGGKITHQNRELDKSFLSLRYRIYDKCEAQLLSFLNARNGAALTETEIDTLFADLNQVAANWVDTLAGDFNYSLKSPAVIEGIILELFDSCYLALN